MIISKQISSSNCVSGFVVRGMASIKSFEKFALCTFKAIFEIILVFCANINQLLVEI